MEDALITILSSFNYPVYRQGSLGDNPYPETFFTFWNSDESEHSAYDNDTASVDFTYMVNVYSTSPSLAYSVLDQARRALKTAGWIIATRGYDAASDEITHIGRGMLIHYLGSENNDQEETNNE